MTELQCHNIYKIEAKRLGLSIYDLEIELECHLCNYFSHKNILDLLIYPFLRKTAFRKMVTCMLECL